MKWKMGLVLGAVTPALLFIACSRENALVDGECASGYTLVDSKCVPIGDSSISESTTDVTADVLPPLDGPSSDGSAESSTPDTSTLDSPVDAFVCDDGLTLCSGTCVDTTIDPFNCGGCGVICPSLLCSNSQCEGAVPGHIVIIGHDYQVAYSSAQSKVLSNSLLLSSASNIRVRSYEQYSNATAVANVKAIFNAAALAQNRTVTYTVATQPTDVSTGMTVLNTDVLVVYDQSAAPASTLATIGTSWASATSNFTHVGGIVIVLDAAGGLNPQMPDLLTNAQLLNVAGDTSITTGTALTVVAPQDAVGLNVVSPYGSGNGTAYLTSNEPNGGTVTYVVVDSSAGDGGTPEPVVIDKIAP
jgi:hypothetical protein